MADMVVEEARTDIEDVVQLEDGEEVLFLQSDVTFAKSGCDETGEDEAAFAVADADEIAAD